MVRSLLPAPAELAGQWTFRRRLVDRRTGLFGWARGTLGVDAEAQSWQEAGELDWDGRRVCIQRTMGFAYVGHEWWMTFADGRPFHPWRPGEVVEHPCRADVYRGLLVADRDAARLRAGWDVTGPAKHQRIVTAYRRIAG